jgi:hypothetical protein
MSEVWEEAEEEGARNEDLDSEWSSRKAQFFNVSSLKYKNKISHNVMLEFQE